METHQFTKVYVLPKPRSTHRITPMGSSREQSHYSRSTNQSSLTEQSLTKSVLSSVSDPTESKIQLTKPPPKMNDSGVKKPWLRILLIVLAVIFASIILATMAMSIYGLVLLTKTTTTITATASTTTTTATTSMTTVTTTTVTLPSQCSAGYVTLSDMTRLTIAAGGSVCDSSAPFYSVMNWFRFNGLGGTMITTSSPGPNQCGTAYTGWYPGVMPTQAATVVGTVCFGTAAISCQFIQTIAITNCSAFYLYGLVIPPVCNARYCTV